MEDFDTRQSNKQCDEVEKEFFKGSRRCVKEDVRRSASLLIQ